MREEEPEPRTMMPETIPGSSCRVSRSYNSIARKSGSSHPSSIVSPTACSITRLCRPSPAPASSRRPNLPSACSRSAISTVSRQTITVCCYVTSLRSTISRSPKVAGSSWVSRASASSTTLSSTPCSRKTRSLPSGANRPSWARSLIRPRPVSASPSPDTAGLSRKWTGSATLSLPRRSRAGAGLLWRLPRRH